VFIPASGYVADTFGARRTFCWAIVIFTGGSALCGQADDIFFLVCARLLQGLGGAMMVPVARLILLREIPGSQFMSAQAWFSVPALPGPVLGPPVGGALVTYLSWRWIFYINLPIGLIGLLFVLRFIPGGGEQRSPRFDLVGFFLSGISLSSLMFGLELITRATASP